MTLTSTRATIQDYAASLNKHAEILLKASEIEATAPEDSRDKSIRQILIRASELVRATSLLSLENNHVSASILARALLENLIITLWLTLNDSNPNELEETGLNELTRVARINLENGKLSVKNKLTGKDETKAFLNSEKFKNIPRRKSIATYAQEANVIDLYDIFYRFLSLDTHGHDIQKNSDNSAQSIEDMQCVGALALAVGHSSTKWLLHRQRTDNESLRQLLGFNSD
jgi:Family of unknown function (DUF5677)